MATCKEREEHEGAHRTRYISMHLSARRLVALAINALAGLIDSLQPEPGAKKWEDFLSSRFHPLVFAVPLHHSSLGETFLSASVCLVHRRSTRRRFNLAVQSSQSSNARLPGRAIARWAMSDSWLHLPFSVSDRLVPCAHVHQGPYQRWCLVQEAKHQTRQPPTTGSTLGPYG